MAIFSKTTKEDEQPKATKAAEPKKQPAKDRTGVGTMLLIPRISEKAQHAASVRKYVFVVPISANKTEVRKQVESQYDVKVAFVNILRMEGKFRRYGRSTGTMSDYKKAIVTLTPDSKAIVTAEAA